MQQPSSAFPFLRLLRFLETKARIEEEKASDTYHAAPGLVLVTVDTYCKEKRVVYSQFLTLFARIRCHMRQMLRTSTHLM